MEHHVRNADDVQPEVWDDPVRGDASFRVLFSADRTSSSSLYTGVSELPPGGWLGLHRHAQAEFYYVLDGSGVVVIDGVDHPVTVGSAVFIPGDAEHSSRNTGDVPFRVVYAFATDAIDDVVYRFSDGG